MTSDVVPDARWPHTVELPILGVSVSFRTDSRAVLDVVRETYGAWEALVASGDVVSRSPAVVSIALGEDRAHSAAPPSFRYHVPDPFTMLIESDLGSGVADAKRLASTGSVISAMLSYPDDFSEGLLEPLTLFLLGALDRQPLHAAAVIRDGTAILLEGRSGVGKSTLTYAASRHGFTPLSDEAVYIQMEPALRVWSRRSRIHLREEGRDHFPELSSVVPTKLLGGKTRIVIPAGEGAPRYADRAGLCLLERGARSRLERVSPARAADAVVSHLEPGFDLYAYTARARAVRVAERGAWSLTLAGHPADGVALLEEVAAELVRGG